jgi:serine phosphatase RsbU (regulator of sigma subunit)
MKKIVTSFLFVLLLSIPFLNIYAQEVKITGYVRDESGKGLSNTNVTYGKMKVTSIGKEGKFVLYIKGTSEDFDKTQLQVSRYEYALKESSFNKDVKELIITMWEAQENTGLLLNESGQPMAGTIIFTSGAYTEKRTSNSKGIFTIHIPKNIDISSSTGFKVNDVVIVPTDIKVEKIRGGLNKITLTYRLPKKVNDVAKTAIAGLPSPQGISAYTIVLDGSGATVPNIELTIDKASYKTDASGKVTLKYSLKTYVEPNINDYIVTSSTVDGVTAVVHIRKEGVQEVIKNSYTTSFSSISDELKRTKDLLSLKNVRIRAEIATIEEKLASDKSIKPEQRKQYTDVLGKLKETLAKSEVAYNQLQEQSKEVLLQMQALVSSKQDSLKALKELANILEAKNQKIEEERALENASFRNKIILFSLAILVFALAAVYLLILSRKLSKQKQKLNQINEELKTNMSLVNTQTIELQRKNEDITASINAAKLIQDATLPSEKSIATALDDFFIFYQPRDIVSGDFYYYTQKNGKYIISAADCTGHGVPGAFMSMLGNQVLNEVIEQKGITEASHILNELNTIIGQSLHKEETVTHAGMDLALCVIDKKNKLVEYAGAMNPLYYVQEGEFKEIKADKQAIGGMSNKQDKAFSTHYVSLRNPATFYICSDGFQDQFGGEQGKKFMVKKLKELLLSIYHLPMKEQREILANTFEKWKGKHEQVDDILVIGFNL